jgi:hypothetical protein
MPQTRRILQLLALLALLGGNAHAAGVDWGQQIITSVNNLVGASGGAFVHNGIVMVAWVGFFRMIWSTVNTSWSMIDNLDSFRVHFNLKEILLIAGQMWFLVQLLDYYMVPFPGTNLSVHHIPMYISDGLVAALNQGQLDAFNAYLATVSKKMVKPNPLLILDCLVYINILIEMGILSLVTFILTSFGYIGEAIMIVVGPLFFWCTLVPHCFSWFWNWVQSMFAFAAYRVMASVILYILSDVMVFFFVHGVGADYSIGNWIALLPIVLMLTGLFIFSLFLIPLLCASLFNGAGAIGQAVSVAAVSALK